MVIIIIILSLVLVFNNINSIANYVKPKKTDLDTLTESYEQGFISKKDLDKYINSTQSKTTGSSEQSSKETKENQVAEPENKTEVHKKSILSTRCPEGKEFVLNSHVRLYTLQDLHDHLDIMHESVFHHHVNSRKNDFATWVRDVFKEHEVASKIQECVDKHSLKHLLGELK